MLVHLHTNSNFPLSPPSTLPSHNQYLYQTTTHHQYLKSPSPHPIINTIIPYKNTPYFQHHNSLISLATTIFKNSGKFNSSGKVSAESTPFNPPNIPCHDQLTCLIHKGSNDNVRSVRPRWGSLASSRRSISINIDNYSDI